MSETLSATPPIGDFLADERALIDLEVSSRKRLFEQLAKLAAAADNGADFDAVLSALTKREKLGCTGLGNGIALPHGRIESFAEPVIAVARLARPLEYDAPDGQPIWLAVCMLAPTEARETHLQLLAALARRFSDADFLKRLRQSRNAAELAAHFRR